MSLVAHLPANKLGKGAIAFKELKIKSTPLSISTGLSRTSLKVEDGGEAWVI